MLHHVRREETCQAVADDLLIHPEGHQALVPVGDDLQARTPAHTPLAGNLLQLAAAAETMNDNVDVRLAGALELADPSAQAWLKLPPGGQETQMTWNSSNVISAQGRYVWTPA